MTTAPGRRAAATGRRRDPVLVAAVALPLLTLGTALLVHTDTTTPSSHAPITTPLDHVDLICPPVDAPALIASLGGGDGGTVTVGHPDSVNLPVRPHTPTQVPAPSTGDDAVIVTGRDAAAAGLLGARFATPLAAVECRAPAFDEWFTGAGAGAKHDSTLVLVNPDTNRAIVDVEVLGGRGPVSAPKLRGLAVPGHTTVRLDLGAIVPRGDDLALHVRTERGRVGASVADAFDKLGGQGRGADALTPQDAPTRSNLLLGPPSGSGRRTLVLANPGADQGRATVQLVTESSTFTPEGLDDVKLPPGTAVRVKLGDVLKQSGSETKGQRLVGLLVDSTVPATADLLTFVDGDLTHATSLGELDGPAAALLPDASSRLLVAGAVRPGVVTVETWGSGGNPLPDQRVAVTEGAGALLDVPDRARLVRITPARTSVSAVVVAAGSGSQSGKRTKEPGNTTLVQLAALVTTGLVPRVTPAIP